MANFEPTMRDLGLAVLLGGLLAASAQAANTPSLPAATCTNNFATAGRCTLAPVASILSTSAIPTNIGYNYVTLYYYFQIPSALSLKVPVHVQAFLEASRHLTGDFVPDVGGIYPPPNEYAVFNVNTKIFLNGQSSLLYAGIGEDGFRGIGPANQIGHNNVPQIVNSFIPRQDLVQTTSLRVDTTMSLQTNTVYTVTLYGSSLYGVTSGSFSRSGSAFVDPYFEIDPAFLAANPQVGGLILSAGVANQPVPEPAPWLLFAAGLSGLALRAVRWQRGAARGM